VTEVGFTPHKAFQMGQRVPTDDGIQLGILVKNPCRQAAVNVHVTAHGLDRAGRRVANPLHPASFIQSGADVPAIMPGQTVAVSAGVATTDTRGDTRPEFGKLEKFSATAHAECWVKAGGEYAPMPTASKVNVGPLNADGSAADRYANVSFRLAPATTTGPTKPAVVFRDEAGHVVDVEEGTGTYSTASPSAGRPVITVWVPPTAAPSKTTVMMRPDPERQQEWPYTRTTQCTASVNEH